MVGDWGGDLKIPGSNLSQDKNFFQTRLYTMIALVVSSRSLFLSSHHGLLVKDLKMDLKIGGSTPPSDT